MKKYLLAIFQSFGSARLYVEAIYRWTGNGFVYLLALAGLLALIMISSLGYEIYVFNRDNLSVISAQVPDITISDGIVTSPAPQPYIIKDADGEPLIVMDLEKNEADLKKQPGYILISKKFMLIQQNKNDYKRFEMSEFGQKTYHINKATFASFSSLLPFMVVFLLPVLWVTQWVTLLIMTILAACLSYVVTAYMPEEYNFETRMRIAVIAITPPLLVAKLLQLFTHYHLGFWVIVAIWVLHIYIMIIASRHYLRKYPLDLDAV